MPRGDRTGPQGLGPMTGRGMGFCAGYPTPGYMTPGPGYGQGMGYGRGRGLGRGMGWRRWAVPNAPQPVYPANPQPSAPTDEKKMLQEETELLQEELKLLQDRIKELEKGQQDQK